jgi:hypothetical protein
VVVKVGFDLVARRSARGAGAVKGRKTPESYLSRVLGLDTWLARTVERLIRLPGGAAAARAWRPEQRKPAGARMAPARAAADDGTGYGLSGP